MSSAVAAGTRYLPPQSWQYRSTELKFTSKPHRLLPQVQEMPPRRAMSFS